VGTPGYRAPECSGHTKNDPTIRADLYSAGKILWSIVTDQNTFEREKPAFNELSLSKLLPDSPMTWHLHHVFEKTIRQNPIHRYENVAQAIEKGRMVQDRIRRADPPLEILAKEIKRCPVCGIGVLYPAGHLIDNTLIDHMTQKQFQTDKQLAQEIGTRGEFVRLLLLCTYCGFGCFWSYVIVERNLKHRETLE
jgi:serine/threonine protein kinase